MGTQLDKFMFNLGFISTTIKHLSNKETPFEETAISLAQVIENNTFDENVVKVQIERLINYLNDQLILTPSENKYLYINEISKKLKDVEMTLFGNWDNMNNYIYNDITIKHNFDLFSKLDLNSPEGKYIKSCLWLFLGVFKGIEELCVKFDINFQSIKHELNFILPPFQNNNIAPKPFAGLLIDLSDQQSDKLFELLTTENKTYIKPTFIDKETDRQSFNYIFGGTDKPIQFKPIEWIANKQFLIDLFTGIQIEAKYNKSNPDTRELSNEIKRQIELFFIDRDTKQPLKLPKNNNRLTNRPEHKAIIKFLATL